MKNQLSWLLAMIAVVIIAGCSSTPSVLKGTVVMRTATEAHINLGSDDGIQVGDTLSVWRDETSGRIKTRNVRVGEVKVIKILGKNYSAVELLRGNLNEQDVVEKRSP